MAFDWGGDDKTIIRLSTEMIDHRENRSSQPRPLKAYWFVYESPFRLAEAAAQWFTVPEA